MRRNEGRRAKVEWRPRMDPGEEERWEEKSDLDCYDEEKQQLEHG